jgi:hypothetical protein
MMASSRYFPRICLEELRETTSRDRLCPGRDSKRTSPEYKSRPLLPQNPVMCENILTDLEETNEIHNYVILIFSRAGIAQSV